MTRPCAKSPPASARSPASSISILCDATWRAVEIDKAGWRIVDRPSIRFRRSPDMLALPEPRRGGSIDALRPLLNIGDGSEGDDDFVLAIAYVLACLSGRGPYPVMVVGGEQGTAKSTRSALLRSVVDPGKPILRSLPRNEHDLFIAARNRHVLAFDNISGLPQWLSDALCRIASGAGFGTRQLYCDADEELFDGARPIILNGIEEVVERPDLAERALFATCEPIAEEARKSDEEVWAELRRGARLDLGALLDAVSIGLRNAPSLRPPLLPRMADFAKWAIACEPALWGPGEVPARLPRQYPRRGRKRARSEPSGGRRARLDGTRSPRTKRRSGQGPQPSCWRN